VDDDYLFRFFEILLMKKNTILAGVAKFNDLDFHCKKFYKKLINLFISLQICCSSEIMVNLLKYPKLENTRFESESLMERLFIK